MKYAELAYKYINNSSNILIKHIKQIENNSYNNFHKTDFYEYSNNNIIYRFDIYEDQNILDQNILNQNILNQKGGSTQTINVDNKEYILDIYNDTIEDIDDLFFSKDIRTELSDEPYKVIFAMPLRKKNNNIIEKIPSNMCFSLVYKTKDKLELKGLQVIKGCVGTVINKSVKKANKQGTIMLKYIIQYAKDNNFKSIELIDGSYYACSNTLFNKSYSIPRIHTLCYSEPWYYRYGFRYIKKDNNINVKNNKKILDKLKTSDLRFDILIDIIQNKLRNENLSKISSTQILDIIQNISSIYSNTYDKPIYDFFKLLTYNHCDIMGLIDEDIFFALQLKLSEAESDNKMILLLN
jgi:hypothetical protein